MTEQPTSDATRNSADHRLDLALREAARDHFPPRPDWLAAVTAAALAEQPAARPTGAGIAAVPARPRPLWPALGGLLTAGIVGLAIGVAAPDGVTALNDALWGATLSVDLLPTSDPFGLES